MKKIHARLLGLALAGAMLCAPMARAANDTFNINGLPFFTSVPGGFLPAFAAYFPNGLGGPTNPLTVAPPVPATLYNVPATLSASAAALPSQALVNGLTCYPNSANVGTNYWGGTGLTTSNGVPMIAGQPFAVATNNSSAVYILGANTTDTVRCVGN